MQTASVHCGGRYEGVMESARVYENPVHDVEVMVEFVSPTGRRKTVEAFWDGGQTWRARFSPDEVGGWEARAVGGAGDVGLDSWSATFESTPYGGENPMYAHGPVRVSGDGHHLEHEDGTPFFLLGDTAWNGPMLSTPEEWTVYLADRQEKRFNAVLFLPTQFRACAGTRDGRRAYYGREPIRIDPLFFQQIDARVDQINEAGMLGVPLLLHAGKDTTLNVGFDLGPHEAMLLARYMVARYGGHSVLWDFVSESSFEGDQVERWKTVGRQVFGRGAGHPVTLHPYGRRWVPDELLAEPWLDVLGYQSDHSDDDGHWEWILHGPPSVSWQKKPARPVINLEPPYEGHLGHPGRVLFDDFHVRRASYWSVLVAPPAGVVYGGHGVWGWDDGSGPPMAHPESGTPKPWREALQLPGATSMMHMAELMSTIEWWRLRPFGELLVDQPGGEDVTKTVVAARTEAGDLALIYAPTNSRVVLNLTSLKAPVHMTWVNARSGEREDVGDVADDQWAGVPSGPGDWLLVISTVGSGMDEGAS